MAEYEQQPRRADLEDAPPAGAQIVEPGPAGDAARGQSAELAAADTRRWPSPLEPGQVVEAVDEMLHAEEWANLQQIAASPTHRPLVIERFLEHLRGRLGHGGGQYVTGRVDPAGRVRTHCRFTSRLIADGLARLGIQAEIRVVPHWHLAHRYVVLPESGVGLTHADDLYDRSLADLPTGQLLLDISEIERYWQTVTDAYLRTEADVAGRLASEDEAGTAAPALEGTIEVATRATSDAEPEWHTVPLSDVVDRMPAGLRAELATPARMTRAVERCRPVIAKMGQLDPERS